jgi:glycerol-3-phosphate acyltransferase PlsY
VALIAWYGKAWGLEEGTLAMAGLAAFAGHLFPVFFRFQGGKGVATALGVLFGIHWGLGLATALTWLIIAWFFRYSSLASLVSAVFAPVYYVFGDGVAWYLDRSILLAIGVMAMLLLWRHAQNINRLVKGTESRLGAKKT